jgi:hypothetical protein
MGDLFNIVFGEVTLVQLIGYVWFFIVGYIIYGLTETSGRDASSKSTPVKWSWKFWFKDNWKRYLTTIMCTYVLFVFYDKVSGHPFENFDAIQLGLVGDGIAATIKKRTKIIGGDREKLMSNMTDEERG